MPNAHVIERLTGIHGQLLAAHAVGKSLSSSSKGREREAFINDFLKAVFPPTFRFGSGDITDISGNRSGQLDVVIEYPFGPSLPSVGSSDVRLYLAESVAAVIEVKSDIANQWAEVEGTARALATTSREFEFTSFMGKMPSARIPLVAVGYEGWKTRETVEQKLVGSNVDAIFVINPGIFVASPKKYGRFWGTGGPMALWTMISFLHIELASLQSASVDPMKYVSAQPA